MSTEPLPELSDEEIQKQLAGEVLRGPLDFRGRTLAPLSRGLRDLRNKVIAPDDTGTFHDVALLHILAEAHAETPVGKLEKRRGLILATDDITGFRTTINLLVDELSDEEVVKAKQLVSEILGLVEKAEVTLAEKKTDSGESAAPSPTPTP